MSLYLKEVMEACEKHIALSGIVPSMAVLTGYAPSLETQIMTAVNKLKVVVLLHKPVITNTGDDNHEASFAIEVGTNTTTSPYECTAVAEQIYSLLNGFHPNDAQPSNYYEITPKSMQSAGEGVCVLTFSFLYQPIEN